MSALLEVEGLTKNFGGLSVVSDVSFDLGEGERLALIGPNGAGKTTVFNLLSGVYEPSGGAIRLGGRDISRVPSRDRVKLGMARTFQNIRLMPHGVARRKPCCMNSGLILGPVRSSPRCPMASARRSRLFARSHRAQSSSCSTSPPPASTLRKPEACRNSSWGFPAGASRSLSSSMT